MNKPAAKPLNDCKNSQRFSYLNKFSTQHAKMELFESVIRKTHQTKRCLQNQQQNRLVLLYEAECFCKKFDNEYSLVQYKLDVVIKNTYFSKLQNRIHKNLNSNSRSRINPEADVELQFYPQLYLMSNNLVVKVAIGALSFAALAFGTLFWLNKKLQSQTQPLTKQQVIELLKLIRRHKYGVYKQITTFVLNISREMRGNINNQIIRQFLDGPESPLKIRDEFQKIQENVCLEQKTTVEAFNAGVQTFKADQQVLTLLKQQDQDLQISMAGKLPTFELQIPEFFTKESFIKTQNLITKKTYLHQVAVFKKIAEYTQEELEQNPAILGEFGNHEQELQFILQEQKLGTKYDPPFAVYNAATLKYLNDATTRNQLAKIEEGYQRILKKYTMKLQNKTIRPQELDQMEDQIMYFDPLA